MNYRCRPPLVLLLVLALTSMSFGQERLQRASGGTRRSHPAPTKTTPRSAAASKARAALTSVQAQSLVRLPYRRNVVPTNGAQGETDGANMDGADNDLYVETTVYGGAAAPYVMAGYARGGLGPGIYPYAPGPLATAYSYGVYGYPYYSFNRPSLAYSWWGPPGMVGPSYFGYGGYGLPYGYYGYGGAFYW